VLLTAQGIIKVADLGLAKALDEDVMLTRTGAGAGTPLYMAPEQGRDLKRVDLRCDLYALGCMLYRCLAGKPPFSGATMLEAVEAKEKGNFLPARRCNVAVPQRLDLLIDKLLAPRPEHRYQSCAELIRDLRSLGLAHEAPEFQRSDAPRQPPPRPPAQGT